MITADDLAGTIGLGSVPDEELVGILAGVLPLSRWESGRRVSYFHPQEGHALDVVYGHDGRIVAVEPAAGITTNLLDKLREQASSAFDDDAPSEVCRDPLFSVPRIQGYWRHQDQWQILPAPAHAPDPDFELGEHPFVLEYKIKGSSNHVIALTRRQRRLWELHVLLSLLLRGRITREPIESPHHWVLLDDPTNGGFRTAYANEGYMVGAGFVSRAADFSDHAGLAPLLTTPDDAYYARRDIEPGAQMDVPASIDEFFDRFEAADPDTREKLLRAAYWFDAAYRVWHISKSLSFVAAISAIETLFPEREGHKCPECDRFHDSPGPTARFRTFVESYAGEEAPEDRSAIYSLRSTFTHGSALHGLDAPRAWGALEPTAEGHRDLHDAALSVARTAIRIWFMEHSSPPIWRPEGRPITSRSA